MLLLVTALSGSGPAAAQTGETTVIAGIPASFPPHYSSKNNQPTGFAIDIMEEIAARSSIRVIYRVFPTWEELHRALRQGEIDIIPNMGISESRSEFAYFTAPLETFDLKFFIRSTAAAAVSNPEDLAGRKVAAVKINMGARLLENRADIELVVYDSLDEAVIGLLASHVDALVYPAPVVLHKLYESGLEDRISALPTPLKEIKRAIAVRRDRPELYEKLDAAAAEFVKSDRYLDIYTKWFGAPAPFWNTRRTVYLMGSLLLAVASLLVFWRYRSIRRLNRELTLLLREQERTRESLRKSEEQYREFIENTDNIVTRVDAEGKFLFLNPKAAEIFGRTVAGCLGRDSFEVVHPDDRDTTRKVFESLIAGKKSYANFENRVVGRHGEVRMLYWTINLHYDENDRIRTINSIATDLTELRRKEEELAERESKIRHALHMTRTGVWSYDLKNGKVVWSDEIYRLLHYDPGAIQPSYENWLARVHPDDLPAVRKQYENLAGKKEILFEYRIRWPDETTRWVRDIGWVSHDPYGKPESLDGINIDITEHKLSRAELDASERKVRLLLDATAEGIYGIDLDGNCVFINRSCLELLGYDHENEVLGKNMHSLIHHTRRDGTEYPPDECQIVQKPFLTGQGKHSDTEVLWRRDGSFFDAEYWSYPIMVAGRPAGAVVTFFDISERRLHERELQQYRDNLENLVEERTAELKKIVKLMAGREVRMAELKKEIKTLQERLSEKNTSATAEHEAEE